MDRNYETKIISGFPGIGKTYVFENLKNYKILDSDSSKFSWISEGVRHPDFPNNYVDHIVENFGKVDFILVSSHDTVRKAINEYDNGYFNRIGAYALVYPKRWSIEEYIKRFEIRGSGEFFIKVMIDNWHKYITELIEDPCPLKYELFKGEYLIDVIHLIGGGIRK